ncbi:hypothetical protein TrVGV298_010870 [Trichoderma virens]|nr:hypothetical protein TrVGV298_010870 [Trichoderma virens]
MHSNAVLLLTFVASASAAVRDADPSKCASEALSIAQSIPTPPPALVSDLAKNPQTDACKFSFPPSLSAEFSSYSSEVLSWYNGHKDELTSLASECSVANSYTSLVNTACSTDGSSGSGSGPNTAAAAPTASSGSGSGSGSDSGSDSASKTSGGAAKSTNAGAARETGMAFAALAAAGIAAIL